MTTVGDVTRHGQTNLENFQVGSARTLEYIFASVANARNWMTFGNGAGISEHPTMFGAAFVGSGIGLAFVFYLFAHGLRRMMRGLAGIAMAVMLMSGSFSILLVAFAPSTNESMYPLIPGNTTILDESSGDSYVIDGS
jgi:hypothetical protein